MRLSECEIGDIVKCGRREMEYVGYDLNECHVLRIITSTYISEPKNSLVRFSLDMDGLTLISKNSQKSLENKTKEKELELEILKNELKEVNRKKMFENIIPGNVYRFTWYLDGSDVRYVRDRCGDKLDVINVINNTCCKLYINEVEIAEYLPELTETYKKLKDLLEKA